MTSSWIIIRIGAWNRRVHLLIVLRLNRDSIRISLLYRYPRLGLSGLLKSLLRSSCRLLRNILRLLTRLLEGRILRRLIGKLKRLTMLNKYSQNDVRFTELPCVPDFEAELLQIEGHAEHNVARLSKVEYSFVAALDRHRADPYFAFQDEPDWDNFPYQMVEYRARDEQGHLQLMQQ